MLVLQLNSTKITFSLLAPPVGPSILRSSRLRHLILRLWLSIKMQTQKQVKSMPSTTKKRQYSTFSRQAKNGSPEPQKPGSSLYSTVSTPPLSIPVPQDTPRFADLGSQNIIHPTLLQTITQDLKFDHMMPVQA